MDSSQDEGDVNQNRESMSMSSDAAPESLAKQRKRAEPVKSACVQCQKRKTKCSGDRPICRFCSDRDLTCSWDIRDGMTRTADLKQRLQDATGSCDDLTQQLLDEENVSDTLRQQVAALTDQRDDHETLVDSMRSGSDQFSTMLLARLRMGASLDDLVGELRPVVPKSEDVPQSLSTNMSGMYVLSSSDSVPHVALIDAA
jgi:chromosome segregation ATPase